MNYYNVFDGETLEYICQVGTTEKEPKIYDPRIKGNGNVIWQKV